MFFRGIKLKDCPFSTSSFTTTYSDPVSFFSSHLFPQISLVFFTGKCNRRGLKKRWKKGKLERKIHRYSYDLFYRYIIDILSSTFSLQNRILWHFFFLTNLLWRDNNDRFLSSSPPTFFWYFERQNSTINVSKNYMRSK